MPDGIIHKLLKEMCTRCTLKPCFPKHPNCEVLYLRNLISSLLCYLWQWLCGGSKVEAELTSMLLLQVHSSQSHDKKFTQLIACSASAKDSANQLLVMNHHEV